MVYIHPSGDILEVISPGEERYIACYCRSHCSPGLGEVLRGPRAGLQIIDINHAVGCHQVPVRPSGEQHDKCHPGERHGRTEIGLANSHNQEYPGHDIRRNESVHEITDPFAFF